MSLNEMGHRPSVGDRSGTFAQLLGLPLEIAPVGVGILRRYQHRAVHYAVVFIHDRAVAIHRHPNVEQHGANCRLIVEGQPSSTLTAQLAGASRNCLEATYDCPSLALSILAMLAP